MNYFWKNGRQKACKENHVDSRYSQYLPFLVLTSLSLGTHLDTEITKFSCHYSYVASFLYFLNLKSFLYINCYCGDFSVLKNYLDHQDSQNHQKINLILGVVFILLLLFQSLTSLKIEFCFMTQSKSLHYL